MEYLFDAGPTMAGGLGPSALTHQELLSWQLLSGNHLSPWESKFIRLLSHVYVSELSRAEDPAAKPPVAFKLDRDSVARKIDELLG